MKKLFLLAYIFQFALADVQAQHFLDGTWEGNYKGFLSFVGGTRKVVVHLHISEDNVVTGTSHLYYNNKNHYEHYAICGDYNPQDSTIFFSEDSVIAVNMFLDMTTCMGDYTMKLTTTDTLLKLNGVWEENDKLGSGCGNSGVWLTKQMPRKKNPVTDKNLQRVTDVQKIIEIDPDERDSIKIELADDAQIDGDVVSVYFNDSLIIHKQRLSAKPVTFYISVPPDANICNLQMVAESMGSIPPCTAAMTIITQKKNYQLNLSSSMSNNSVVQFFLKE